jgi:hypothetical protein
MIKALALALIALLGMAAVARGEFGWWWIHKGGYWKGRCVHVALSAGGGTARARARSRSASGIFFQARSAD